KPDCYAHEQFETLEKLNAGVKDMTLGELLKKARSALGASAVIQLSRDIIVGLSCDKCQTNEPVFRSLGKVTESEGRCPVCKQMRAPVTASTLGLEEGLESMTFAQLGIPPFDVVTARASERSISYVFDGDAAEVLGP